MELETLFDEIRASVVQCSWFLATLMLGAGAWYLPSAFRSAQLHMPHRGLEVMADVGRSRSYIALGLRPMQEVELDYYDENGDRQQGIVRCPTSQGIELRALRKVPILYDRLDSSSVQVLSWTPPNSLIMRLWLGALLFPVLGHVLGWRIAHRRRRAFRLGEPAVAKVRGYHRFMWIHYLELDYRRNDEEHRLMEPISPAEADLHSPLTSVAVVVHPRSRGGLISCTVGNTDPEE